MPRLFHSSVDRYIGCFRMSTIVYMLLWTLGCICLFALMFLVWGGYLSRSGISGSYGGSLFCFVLFFWEASILFFHSGCINLHWCQQCMRVPFSPHPCNICYLCSYWWSLSWQVCGDISLWFRFALPWCWVMVSILSCACWPSACPLWKDV